jgi:8-oxo-dGTP pyrophosphatase MutT (NUDIX family)
MGREDTAASARTLCRTLSGVAEPARTILLRRPPEIRLVEGRFVPRADLDEVERRWEGLVAANPRYFDGSLVQVLGVRRNGHGGVTIHGMAVSYRFYAVQRTGLDTGVRVLGAKALARHGGRYLMGRRSASVAFYPEEWEFLPGGGIEPGVTPAETVRREFGEETGFRPVTPPRAVALLYDPIAFSWEVIHEVEVEPHEDAPTEAWEHHDRAEAGPGEWPLPLCDIARRMAELVDPAARDATRPFG